MKRLYMLCLFLLALFAQPALADSYAAIAYSPRTGAYGYSYDYSSRSQAERAALNRCRGNDARVVVWVKNGWAAVARSRNGSWATGWSSRSKSRARYLARRNVRGGGGRNLVWVYSGN
jgi:hypothetical protein